LFLTSLANLFNMAKLFLALACLACGGHGRRVQTTAQELSPSMSRLGEFLLASGPARGFAHTSRHGTPTMSHFSNIKTKFLEKNMLVKSLKDLGHVVLEADGDSVLPVRGYQGAEETAQIVMLTMLHSKTPQLV
jgi:hypothetical protein